ncbi:MAG: T9SS type A sorting domain-containing protein [Bacteroidetes bacterium]|nr:T9SS type A sorting domain-containing protein [Bacteroidota bacterium]
MKRVYTFILAVLFFSNLQLQAQCGITLSSATTTITCNGGTNGAITATAGGGTPYGTNSPGLIISEFLANPQGTDAPYEYVELLATKEINFATTPYTVIFSNNGIANASGWTQGGLVTYAFEISAGKVNVGDVVYVGGSSMNVSGTIVRSIFNDVNNGDGGIGTAQNNVLGNGGANADGIAVFNVGTASLTNSTVPVDAIFFGSSIGSAEVSSTQGYQLPVNDLYSGGKLTSTSFLLPDPQEKELYVATGTYNEKTLQFSSARTWSVTTTSSDKASFVNLINLYDYAWSTGSITNTTTGLSAGTYTVSVTDAVPCAQSFTVNVAQPSVIAVSFTKSNISCNGLSNGLLVATPSGGAGAPYSYLWGNGSTTSTISGLGVGTYSVLVSDKNGCVSNLFTESITQPAALTVSLTSSNNVSCKAGTNGLINITTLGGTLQYSYSWSNAATTEDLTSIGAGTYAVLVTDANACTQTFTTSITEPASALTASASVANVICFGATTGSINLSATGGTAGYAYMWSNSATTEDVSGVAAGSYSVTITDGNACTLVKNYTLTQNTAITASATVSNLTCFGNQNGSITLYSTLGGTPGYTYSWNNGATTANISGAASGNYNVTITDSQGCTSVLNYVITSPSALSATTSVTHVVCNGGVGGVINLGVFGGVVPHTFLWSNGSTTQNINTLSAGVYQVTIKDANNCTLVITDTINQPTAFNFNFIVKDACYADTSGSINLTVSGNTAPYSYSWSTGDTKEDLNKLTGGMYYVAITDINNCVGVDSVNVNELMSPITITDSIANATCNGINNGMIDITVNGGYGNNSFLWSNNSMTEDIDSVTVGMYNVTVTDGEGCTASAQYTIAGDSALTLTLTQTHVVCFADSNGAVLAAANGGVMPYSFMWSNTATTAALANLMAGTYYVTAMDSVGCMAMDTITLNQVAQVASGVSASDSVLCKGEFTTLTASSANGGISYVWFNNQTTNPITVMPTATTNYSVTALDSVGCSASVNITITVNNLPPVVFNVAPDTLCSTSFGALLQGGSPVGGTYSGSFVNSTNDYFNVSAAGLGNHVINYSYTDSNGCSLMVKDTLSVVLCTGIEEETASYFGLYPNPNDGNFSVEVNSTLDNATLTIINNTGATVYTQAIEQNMSTVSLNTLPKGLYMVVITNSGTTSTKRVIIQ